MSVASLDTLIDYEFKVLPADEVLKYLDRRMEKKMDMRELSPDAPRYTSNENRCVSQSYIRPDCRCILRSGHHMEGFLYCQFNEQHKG